MKKCKSSSLVQNIYIAAPCPVSWDSMQGDDKVRLCNGCSKSVYNLSAMSSNEADGFLRKNGVSECMILFRRADGTVITDNCPIGLRRLRDQWRRTLGLVSGFLALLMTAPSSWAQNANTPQRRMVPAQTEKHQSYNPAAGGAMAMPPSSPTGPVPVIQSVPVQTTPRQGIREAPPSPPRTQPISTSRQPTPAPIPAKTKLPAPAAPKVREHTDKQAQQFFEKGQDAERTKQPKLAEFYYEKSLDFFDAQINGDKQFRSLISDKLNRVRKQLGTNTN